jgi:hypothetical protein
MDTGVVWVGSVVGYGPTINIGFRSDSQFLPGGSLTFLEKQHIERAVEMQIDSNEELSGAFEVINHLSNPKVFDDPDEFAEFVWRKVEHSIGHDWHPGMSNLSVVYKGYAVRVWYVT